MATKVLKLSTIAMTVRYHLGLELSTYLDTQFLHHQGYSRPFVAGYR